MYAAIMAKLLTMERAIAELRDQQSELRAEMGELRATVDDGDFDGWFGGTD
jgi:hypothetical protein